MTDLRRFGALGPVPGEYRCIAFDENGDRCPRVATTDDGFCPDCTATDALLTTEDLGVRWVDARNSGVRDLLRDGYGFEPLDAVVFGSISAAAIDTAYILEGRLVTLKTNPDREAVSLAGYEYDEEQLVALLERFRSNVESESVRSKWDGACKLVEHNRRCSASRQTAVACGWHHRRGEEDELTRVDGVLETVGPGDAA